MDITHVLTIPGMNPMKFYSFCKVGGGFRAEDYEKLLYLTTDKWIEWDRKHPPTEFIELAGSDGQHERPDLWIKPSDSVVVGIKAASVGPSDSFKTNFTLRFPRFKALRTDKDWQTALSIDEFIRLKSELEDAHEKRMEVDRSRKMSRKRTKRDLTIAGDGGKVRTPYAGPETDVFKGLKFCVLSEMIHPSRKTKAEIEQIIKSNGGSIFQSPTAKDDILCIGDKKVVKVASLIKSGRTNVIKPSWVLDAVEQAKIDGPGRDRYLVPFEPNHMFHATSEASHEVVENVDVYGDSYARDVSPKELKRVLDDMVPVKNSTFSATNFLTELEERGNGLGEMSGSIFRGCVAYFFGDVERDVDSRLARLRYMLASGAISDELDADTTHVVVLDDNRESVRALRKRISERGGKIPRVVSLTWLQDSWKEGTLLDEERFTVVV
jgi:DNA ligase-4